MRDGARSETVTNAGFGFTALDDAGRPRAIAAEGG